MNTIHRGFALEVIVQLDRFSAGRVAAEKVAELIREKPTAVLGLVSGKALMPLYKELIRMYREEGLDFSDVTVFLLDGDVGLDSTHPRSCHQIMWKNFFNLVNFDSSKVHIPNLSAYELTAFRADYEKSIQDAGGIDLQVLDIRSAGRLAAGASAVLLNSPDLFMRKSSARQVVTCVDSVLDARSCLMLASGSSVASAVSDAVEGPLSTGTASLILKQHASARIVLDEDAAGELKLKDYYQWIAPQPPVRQSVRPEKAKRAYRRSRCRQARTS